MARTEGVFLQPKARLRLRRLLATTLAVGDVLCVYGSICGFSRPLRTPSATLLLYCTGATLQRLVICDTAVIWLSYVALLRFSVWHCSALLLCALARGSTHPAQLPYRAAPCISRASPTGTPLWSGPAYVAGTGLAPVGARPGQAMLGGSVVATDAHFNALPPPAGARGATLLPWQEMLGGPARSRELALAPTRPGTGLSPWWV